MLNEIIEIFKIHLIFLNVERTQLIMHLKSHIFQREIHDMPSIGYNRAILCLSLKLF